MNEEGLWQDILKKKYLKGKALAQIERKTGDLHFWSRLMEVENIVFLERVGSWSKMVLRLDYG
jgi:hypothetical protein